MSRVSVIIPNYNRATLIGETISNVLNQTLPPHEIIVVDDGSQDDSVGIIRSFGRSVTLLQQSNHGPGSARNTGLGAATGDFIQFQDSDDLLSLNKLEAQARALQQTGADIAFGPWAHVRINRPQIAFETCVLQQAMPHPAVSMASWLLRGWSTTVQSLLFRRSFLAEAGNYRADLWYGEDMEFFFRMLVRGPRVAFAGQALTLYRTQSPGKLSQDTGLAWARRVVDWAKYVSLTLENQKAFGYQADFWTRSIHLSSIRKHLRYLRAVPEAPAQLIRCLADETTKAPQLWLAMVELWLRVAERNRLRRSGFRWMACYRPAPPLPEQLSLMANLGFNVSSSAV
jgi:glycosyltransferase involved in cell wall biosynthesis